MKAFTYVLLFALVGAALCARLRRDASSADDASGASDSAASDGSDSAASVDSAVDSASSESAEADGTEVNGLKIAVAALKAQPLPDLAAIEKLEAIDAYLSKSKDAGMAAAAVPVA